MILFDLQCDKNHKFECWFASSANYEEQLKNKMIECPYCNSKKIQKSLMVQRLSLMYLIWMKNLNWIGYLIRLMVSSTYQAQ